jgi:hypothetical protein
LLYGGLPDRVLPVWDPDDRPENWDHRPENWDPAFRVGWWTQERDATLSRMWMDQRPVSEIAATLGIDETQHAAIGYRRIKLGLPPRRIIRDDPTKLADQQHLTKLWNSGMSTKDIAAVLGISPKAVSHRRAEYGLPKRASKGGRPEIDDEKLRKRFIRLWNSDTLIKDIAAAFNISVKTVYSWQNLYGLPDRSKHGGEHWRGKRDQLRPRFIKMWNSEASYEDIATAFNISTNSVQRWRCYYGLPARRPQGSLRSSRFDPSNAYNKSALGCLSDSSQVA